MRLTKKKSMEICIELWTYLEETGNEKEDWSGWEKYGEMRDQCPLCEYNQQHYDEDSVACNCPLAWPPFNGCCDPPSEFRNWNNVAHQADRKRFAKAFLKQLKEIKWG